MLAAPIETPRMRLAPIAPAFMEAIIEERFEDAAATMGVTLPGDRWPDPGERWLRLRLAQLRADPTIAPWLSRAMILPDGTMAGHAGFHDRPDADGMVEIGYEVAPGYRRRGLAREAVEALVAWALGQDAARGVRACIGPTNEPSLRLVRSLGFAYAGIATDEVDGEELVFERVRRA